MNSKKNTPGKKPGERGRVRTFVLRNNRASASICNYGARVLAFSLGKKDVVCGPKSPAEVLADTNYCGAICGRVANRIAGAKFSLKGKGYKLAANDGENHLHGGVVGFSHRYWKLDALSDEVVELSLTSPAGDEGYPGQVVVRACYSLLDTKLRLTLMAFSTEDTLLNLTNHVYWNLAGRGTIDAHTLMVDADHYTPMIDHIPTGAVQHVKGSGFDLRRPQCLGGAKGGGPLVLDDNYVLSRMAQGNTLRPVASLSLRNLRMELSTNAPGLQVYTGDGMSTPPRGGVALEAQGWPDAPHHADFPPIKLRAGELFTRTICWELLRGK